MPARPTVAACEALLREVRACRRCEAVLPLGPRPVLQLHPSARLLIAGQAPGRRVHASGIPFDDASGERLRDWLGLPRETFYDARRVAILPMGFCYPGTGARGDLPPRPECAPAWRAPLLAMLPRLRLTVVLGRHAMEAHLAQRPASVSEAVLADHGPGLVALPHPSPRNRAWFARHPGFEAELLPALRARVADALR